MAMIIFYGGRATQLFPVLNGPARTEYLTPCTIPYRSEEEALKWEFRPVNEVAGGSFPFLSFSYCLTYRFQRFTP